MLRSEIEKYLRDTLEIHKSIKKIGIRIWVEVDEQSDGRQGARAGTQHGPPSSQRLRGNAMPAVPRSAPR